MINRICISINNRCNLQCRYCHFRENGHIESVSMDVLRILDNVKEYAVSKFKIGYVGIGEGFLDWSLLKTYIQYTKDNPFVSLYTITNGTVDIPDKNIRFLEDYNVNVGFSIDGYRELHNLNRCNSFDHAIANVENYHRVTGHYPTFNATIGQESLDNAEKVIDFFKPFGTRVTFSRMIGKYGITLESYREFLLLAEKSIPIRRGEKDCTMYGGQCGAGINNYFFSNGQVYYCGNSISLSPLGLSSLSFYELEKVSLNFDRDCCFKETL